MKTQQQMADEIGVPRSYVNRVLNDRPTGLHPDTVEAIRTMAEKEGWAKPGDPDRPSMSRIGRELSLSHVVVRAALRDIPNGETTTYVSDETRAKIKAHAEQIGYVPPPLIKRPR